MPGFRPKPDGGGTRPPAVWRRSPEAAWALAQANDDLLGLFLRAQPRLVAAAGEDWRQVARLALYRAALTHDESRAKFGSYAVPAIWTFLVREARARRRAFPPGTYFSATLDAVPDDRDDLAALIDREEAAALAEQVLAQVSGQNPERDREIVARVFGLEGRAPAPVIALAREYDITRARLWQIVGRALRRFRPR